MTEGDDAAIEVLNEYPHVEMFTAPNPGPKTLSGTHSYLVGRQNGYLIDPGPDLPDYQELLWAHLTEQHVCLKGILLTHGHPDHAPGGARLAALTGAGVFGSRAMSHEARTEGGVTTLLSEGMSFRTDGATLHVLETPGHARDQLAFWLPGQEILFVGDTILGVGSTLVQPPEGDMTAYMTTLYRLRALNPRVLACGHGPVVERASEKIDEYVAHRKSRERQILDALRVHPQDVSGVVARVYSDVGRDVAELAFGSVRAQLDKLEREGRVRRDGEIFTLVPSARTAE